MNYEEYWESGLGNDSIMSGGTTREENSAGGLNSTSPPLFGERASMSGVFDSAQLVRARVIEQQVARGDSLLFNNRQQQLSEFNLLQHERSSGFLASQHSRSNSSQHYHYIPPQSAISVRPTMHPKKLRQPSYSDPLLLTLDLCGLEDASLEDIIVKSCRSILSEAARCTLKAVELANFLRARVGSDVLAHIRERWGGLLALLERHPSRFRVERIPKNDMVSLIGFEPPIVAQSYSKPSSAPTIYAQPSMHHAHSPLKSATPDIVDRRPRLILDSEKISSTLLIGGVPPQLNEEQLALEFDRFGEVEEARSIREESNSFALIKFATVEQSVAAKQRISKLPQYAGQVMYANFGDQPKVQHQSPPQQFQYHNQQLSNAFYTTGGPSSPPPPPLMPLLGLGIDQQKMPNNVPMTASTMDRARSLPFNDSKFPYSASSVQPPPGLTHMSNSPTVDPVIVRLSNDYFTFADTWNADPAVDAPLITLIVDELQLQKVVSISYLASRISNLRGVEVNPVALKAMLLRYPHTFQVRGNQCGLASTDITISRASAWF